MPAMPVYKVLTELFLREDIRHCFALLGDANMNWATTLAAQGCTFTFVRDEHCAIAAAMAWSRTTGKLAVASVTCGPGLTQILTALPAAVRARIPMVIFAGEAPLKSAWYNQAIEQRPFVEACGARYVAVHQQDGLLPTVRDAFTLAHTTQQPVVLGIPLDLQTETWQGEPDYPTPSWQCLPDLVPRRPEPQDIELAATLARKAQRIIILAGRGVVLAEAAAACTALASELNALLASTLPARGLFADHPHCIGIAGGFSSDTARRCLAEADLIIAVGCRLASHTSDAGKLFDASAVLHIDNHPRTVSQGRHASNWQIQGDARLTLDALLLALQSNATPEASNVEGRTAGWPLEALAHEIRTAPPDGDEFDVEPDLLDPRQLSQALDALLPLDWYTVNSSGHCSYFVAHMPNRPVDRFLTIREFGAIGNGLAFAMGVAAAVPDNTVVLFDGDGSLLMHIQELETLRRHGLKVLICVLNDGAYGSEIHKLRAEGLPETGAVFGREDFARIALGFGLDGYRIESLQELPTRLSQFEQSSNSCLWDFHISDRVVSPVIRRSHGH